MSCSPYNLIISQRPHLQIPSHWGLGFNIWIWERHTTIAPKVIAVETESYHLMNWIWGVWMSETLWVNPRVSAEVTGLMVLVVYLLSCVQLIVTPWIASCQAPLSFTISWNLLKLMSIESVMPSNHLFLCCPLLLLPSIFPSIRVFSTELAYHIRWPKYWSFSFSISPSNDY